MTTDPQFAKEDVWNVARAVVEDFYYEESLGMNAYNRCRYCHADVDHRVSPSKIQHGAGCTYLIALDLLTGAPNE